MPRPLTKAEKLAPVKLTLTLHEIAALHLLCAQLLRVEDGREKFSMIARIEPILRKALEDRACVETPEGWMA